MNKIRMKTALRAAAIHLGISLAIAVLVAILVLVVWFPGPYRDLAGGLHLFWLLVIVDVICGPLLTLVLFNPAKSQRELTMDLGLVALVQIAALIYGLHSISQARPVMLVHEVDRFVAVTHAQVDPADIPKALPEFQQFPWFNGPHIAGVRAPKDGPETLASVELSLSGKEPSLRADWWQPYASSVAEVKKRMKKVTTLRTTLNEHQQAVLDQAVSRSGHIVDTLHFLPMTSGKLLDSWIVLLNDNAEIVGYAPIGGFIAEPSAKPEGQ